jgi:choline trimethylamine-lyase
LKKYIRGGRSVVNSKLNIQNYYEYLKQFTAEKSGVSKRVERLLEDIHLSMNKPKKLWDDVGSVLDESTAEMPLIIRNALALKRKLEIAPLGLWEGQLIAGSICLYKEGIMITEKLPKYATSEEIEAASKLGLSVGSIVGHIVPHYPKLLTMGITGIKDFVNYQLKNTVEQDKIDFYKAVNISLDGLAAFSKRYSELLRSSAEETEDSSKKAELLEVSESLAHSPLYPAKNFHQALNCIWITHVAFQLTGNSLAIGRLDQHIIPYLIKDLKKKAIDLSIAQEMLDCFFIKFNERALNNEIVRNKTDMTKAQENNDKNWSKRSPFAHSTQKYNIRDSIDATNHWLQNVLIGGVKPEDGSDATNLATIMCLEAFKRNKLTNPCLTVRLHSRSPQYLLEMVGETLITGGGSPAIFNDDAIIKSLVDNGFPVEAARDYTNDGCWEVIVAGRTDFYFDRFNMLKCLEWALNRGCSRIDGKKEAPDLGDPKEIQSYEELINKFYILLDYELDGVMKKINNDFGKRAMIAPTPLLSALLEGPLENGIDMTAGGTRFITYGLIAEGLSHLIDSFAGVKKVIFEEKLATMKDLIDALDKNFEGCEALRHRMQSAPKYGNNNSYADEIGKEITGYFTEKVKELNLKYNKLKFLPGVGTFSWYMAIGEGLGATPDGRYSAEAVSSNFSPSLGVVNKGVTGAILSHSKMNMEELAVGAPLDLRVNENLVAGSEGRNRLLGIIRSFIQLGGNMLTLTVVSTETLRKAQREPEKYRDLRVRMGGWSAYFTMLSKEQQDHHIRKQEKF